MGMFDYLHVEISLPGCPPDFNEFQTKDLDCLMDHYYLKDDGKLYFEKRIYEDVPEEDRPYFGTADWESPIGKNVGSFRLKEKTLQVHYITAEISFGTIDFNNQWIGYLAKFVNGELQWIIQEEGF
jgi:hypothetical protein